MKIAFVTSEALPFSKTGGLADVVYGLSQALAELGHEIFVICPLYHSTDRSKLKVGPELPVFLSWRHQTAKIYRQKVKNVNYLLVFNEYYFDREQIYGYDDDIERFAFFDLSVIEIVRHLSLRPDVIHVNDWQTAMLPLLLKDQGLEIPTVLTIHNPAFQGNGHQSMLENYFNLPLRYFEDGTCRFHDFCSCLKTGIVTADLVTTVSRTHAKELLEDKVSFNGIGHVIALRKKSFVGIVNGVDVVEFNPADDHFLTQPYDSLNFSVGKRVNRDHLDCLFHQKPSAGVAFGIVSRLTDQKGFDQLKEIFPLILKEKARLYVVGSGQPSLEQLFMDFSLAHPENMLYYGGYSPQLAHLVYAASDYFLMPSRYEPCGIGQLIAKRYGSLPIVSDVGGLVDTVVPFTGGNYDEAEGLRFASKDPDGLLKASKRALSLMVDPQRKKIVKNAMAAPCSYRDIAPLYLEQYLKLQKKR